jgi:O-antigen ligase
VTVFYEKRLVGKVLALASLATLLIVTPWSTLDPINVPKFTVLVISAGILLGLLVKNYKVVGAVENRVTLLFSSIFLLFLLLAFLFSEISKVSQLFGVTGRNTGLLTYISLLLMFLAASTMTAKGFERVFVHTLVLGGALSVGYGLLQSIDLDPADWVNSYSPVIGFLGNPNFQSSFLGMVAVAVFAMILEKSLQLTYRAIGAVYILLSLFVISKSDSQQGFLVFIAGSSVVAGFFIFQSQWKRLSIPYAVMSLLGIIAIALGSLNKGPLASLLYKDSVTYRGDYWRAGWKITTENPLLGVGLDGYGEWYRRARTVEATLRRGPDVTSNAAHNVLLDLSSNGGFPLLGAYLLLISLVLVSVWKVLLRHQKFDPYFAALIGAWVAYNAQSIISLNQIGLAVWGWVLGGAIVGYAKYGSDETLKVTTSHKRTRSASEIAKTKISPAASIAVFSGLIIGATAGLPPYLASTQYRSALESGDVTTIVEAGYISPLDVSRLGQVAATLRDNNLVDQALPVIEDAVNTFPNAYDAWKILASLSNASLEQVEKAKREMKRLDPHNPELK